MSRLTIRPLNTGCVTNLPREHRCRHFRIEYIEGLSEEVGWVASAPSHRGHGFHLEGRTRAQSRDAILRGHDHGLGRRGAETPVLGRIL